MLFPLQKKTTGRHGDKTVVVFH